MMSICPRCNRRVLSSNFNTDIEHICDSGDTSLDNEDVIVIGTWNDYTGSQDVAASVLQTAGLDNELRGTRAGIEGEDFDGVTSRGHRASTHRSRQHIEFIDLRGKR